MKLPSQCLPLPEVHYDGFGSCYWRRNSAGGWQKINEQSLTVELAAQGYRQKPDSHEFLSPLQEAKREIQLQQDVVFAGSVAGYNDGVHEIQGKRILVTDSPKIIQPSAGEWPTLQRLLNGLLLTDQVDQRVYFYGWVKIASECLRTGKRMPGQALCIAGERNSGKSLVQNLITELLGGRTAKPYQFMTGSTQFNGDLFGAEHLMIEDEVASTDIRSRRHLGAAIKGITVNVSQRCHDKNRKALTLDPFWRLTITVNDEPEDLMVLPPIDSSIEDKIILLKAAKCQMPMPTGSPEEKKVFWDTLVSELPAFLHFLDQWAIPTGLRDSRFGVATYHHPDLLDALTEMQPEIRLLAFIDQAILRSRDAWSGSAEMLEKELTKQDADFQYAVRKLLHFSSACGTYLGRLENQFPERVSSRRVHGKKEWKIMAVASDMVVEDDQESDQLLQV